MKPLDLIEVREKSRRALSRSLFWEAMLPSGLAMLVISAGLVLGGKDAAYFGVIALVVALVSGFSGVSWGRLALAAVVAGTIPLGCGVLSSCVGHVCIGGSCASLCVPTCAAGGVVSGWFYGRAIEKARGGWVPAAAGGLLLCSLGAMGCSCAGHMGILAMAGGFALTVTGRALLRR